MNKIYVLTGLTLIATSKILGQNITLTSSKLPIVIINTKGQTIPDEPKITANMKVISNGAGKINNVSDTKYQYNNAIGIEKRGNSSQGFEQLQYAVETRDSVTGLDLDVPLLNMPKESDWVLYAPYNDISMLRNIIAYDLWNKMGHWAPRTRLCEVILNGVYQGVYVFMESIKRGDYRVKTAKLKYEDTTGINLTGGYIMRIDAPEATDSSFISKVPGVVKGSGGFGGTPTTAVKWLYFYPKSNESHPKQRKYIRNYIDTVETVIQSNTFADPVNGYAKYISKQSFLDYFIHTELSKNGDGYKRSAYFYKEKKEKDGTGGKLKAGPVWDYNLAYGNVNFCGGNVKTGWGYEGCETLPVPALWGKLLQDPVYKNDVYCRYQALRKTTLSDQSINTFIDKYVNDSLKEASVRQLAKYPKLLQTGAGNPLWFAGYRVTSYTAEIDSLKKWFKVRLTWLDNNIIGSGAGCVLTSLQEAQQSDALLLYPNPTRDAFSLESREVMHSVEIFDIQGQRLVSKSLETDKAELKDLSNKPDGVYMIKIFYTDRVQTLKIVKGN